MNIMRQQPHQSVDGFEMIYNILRFLLKWSFLYTPSIRRHSALSGINRLFNNLHTVLSVICCLSTWELLSRYGYFLVSMQTQTSISTELMALYAGFSNALIGCHNATLMLIKLTRKLDTLVESLKRYEQAYTKCIDTRAVVRRLRRIGAVVAVCIFLFTSLGVFVTFRTAEKRGFIWYVTPAPSTSNVPFAILMEFNYLLLLFQQASLSMFYITTCYILWTEIKSVIDRFVSDATSTECSQNEIYIGLIRNRKRFECLVKIIEEADTCVNHYVAANIPGVVAVTCLLLYTTFTQAVPYNAALMSFMVVSIAKLAVIMTGGVILNSKIHDPLKDLYCIGISRLPERAVQEIQMLISQLTGSQIGIRFYGVYVIDKSAIIMVLGTILTYAIFVLQLKPDGTMTELQRQMFELTNCTCRR